VAFSAVAAAATAAAVGLPAFLSVCVSSACVMPIRLSMVLKGSPPAYPLRGIVGD